MVRAEDLSLHNCLTHSYFGKSLWHFEEEGTPVAVAVDGTLSANEATSLLQAARAGAGVVMLPTYLAALWIAAGQLVALLPQARPQDLSIHAMYASHRHMPAALRTMLDFLAQRLPPEPSRGRRVRE